MAQASLAALERLNKVRVSKGYVAIHPEDWIGVSAFQARELLKWVAAAPPALPGRPS